jgi:hypothetical protein
VKWRRRVSSANGRNGVGGGAKRIGVMKENGSGIAGVAKKENENRKKSK